jgi:hypothetical protein
VKAKRGDMVEILWTDTHTPRTMDWMDKATYQVWIKEGMTIRSVGIVTLIDEKYHYLVANIDIQKKTSERTVCGAINIPNGSIKEIHILKRAK